MAMTLAERIMARASGSDSVSAGEFVVADIDLALVHDILRRGSSTPWQESAPKFSIRIASRW